MSALGEVVNGSLGDAILEGAMAPFLLLNNPKLRNAQAFVVPQCKRKKLMWASY